MNFGVEDCLNFGAVVQLVRISACHAGGRGFESRPLRHLHAVAFAVQRSPVACYLSSRGLTMGFNNLYNTSIYNLGIDSPNNPIHMR